MIGWVALAITLAVMAIIALRIDDWSRDWTQNTAQLSPDAEKPELRPLELSGTSIQIAERIESWIRKQPNWKLVSSETNQDQTITLKLTRTTKLFRFVDDIVVVLRPISEGHVELNATSGSRIGKGDLGQNPRNLMELTAGLRGVLP